MPAKIIDGGKIASDIQEDLKKRIGKLKEKGITPTIAPILVGENPGAKVYYRSKSKLADKIGVKYAGIELPESTSKEELIKKIHELNEDKSVHGLFVELPLPKHISITEINKEISPDKDIDCINPASTGPLASGGALSATYRKLRDNPEVLLPATPQSVMEILLSEGVELAGKEIAVVGCGAVGFLTSLLLIRESLSDVTMCDYKGKPLKEVLPRMDVVCTCVGRANFITADMIKPGAVVVDIAIVPKPEGKGITGDVDFENVKEKASLITPVPGGVGSVTTTIIMANTIKAAERLAR
jgi:methylenetetrahydrofolate dehydrogenase (NADP+)/methenyltetrahydrofolate cyclohydrolase